jgi:hypothetical protein
MDNDKFQTVTVSKELLTAAKKYTAKQTGLPAVKNTQAIDFVLRQILDAKK